MKKVSTAVSKQVRNVSQPTLTIGLDLGPVHIERFSLESEDE